MKNIHAFFRPLAATAAFAFCLALSPANSHALSSPYVTSQDDVPLNQSFDDSINGLVPFYSGTSHTPPEGGSILRLSDATSATEPTANVILGPDNTNVRVAWDLGEAPPGMVWRLDRIDIWIAGFDDLRKGFRGHFEVSQTGGDNDFVAIPNSAHWEGFDENDNYNYIRYDFPEEFIAGDEPEEDRHSVTDFRYLLLDSRGDTVPFGGTDWQSRFVEIDVWVTPVPEPGTLALFAGGLGIFGVYRFRRARR